MGKIKSINVPLTDEMKRFVSEQAGDGTMYSTPSEYVRDLIRHDQERKEAEALRESILEGYQDAISGRTRKFSGNLRADLKAFKSSK
ncbi:antitoxin ParD1/3/4 [Roseivirga pacifica]|uniref:Antitoxin ParD1/3/4 n=1 Tax=Roseivirga pacifica TaxID=1267423 RepID=A0A1I0MLR4_9BACT|nr:type II toxin-antitoxin system ParD family antitoxin [Roseivirga pacifica]RKQ50481.1 antitoxin ParD1/3/4 [Roseivirga pacifica]SEV88826.1 antitoxin ParD1/3/4 [Roseivirga pacifica]